jgi:hypothetical protein
MADETRTAEQEEYERRLIAKNEEDGRSAARDAARALAELADGPAGPGVNPLGASTPIQTTYPDTIRPGVAGAIANEEPVRLISRTVEDAAGIVFGKAVIQGVADKGCKLGAFAAGKFVGVTVRERSIKAEFPNGFMQYDSARLMTEGVIWVVTAAAVIAGDPAVFDATGNWTKGTGTGDVPNARWDTSQATPGGLAQLRLI